MRSVLHAQFCLFALIFVVVVVECVCASYFLPFINRLGIEICTFFCLDIQSWV